ncbi:MAG: PEP-CTERM sorting domain-containing protein [Phenylobacterium sp.]|uniref:PEPxxWA-CTERM sorting domain-containing protein n=1 Tax=Phenylobacterium sp. TaxID=1871053 RepID=UPI001A434D10|nr:PEPxxWA-CTERM sorting domain-containing protein [Phenylobacterium sp.]MBL8772314.1 PEP-CTERM sorting domain-containing protein [Phenylobacterium sp.]
MALLTATSAAASSISNINATAGSRANVPGSGECVSSVCNNNIDLPGGEGVLRNAPGSTGGAAYNSFVNIGPSSIFFESSNSTSEGNFSSFQSFSTVSFDFLNSEDAPVAFHSEITPQGLGMYLADTSGGCLFTNSCVQVSHHVAQLSDLYAPGETNGIIGAVGFQFDILDNGDTLYTLSGFLALARNALGCDGYCVVDALGEEAFYEGDFLVEATGARSLNGFARQTDPTDTSAIAFGWDATPVLLSLLPGEHTIEYRTSVFSITNTDCMGMTSEICLVAYSGFGDPIGRGGGIDALRGDLRAGMSFGNMPGGLGGFDAEPFHDLPGGLIQGLNFSPARFSLPVFRNGVLTYDSSTSGAVPEPGTWALMILGFGAMGAALRRRRIPAHI